MVRFLKSFRYPECHTVFDKKVLYVHKESLRVPDDKTSTLHRKTYQIQKFPDTSLCLLNPTLRTLGTTSRNFFRSDRTNSTALRHGRSLGGDTRLTTRLRGTQTRSTLGVTDTELLYGSDGVSGKVLDGDRDQTK